MRYELVLQARAPGTPYDAKRVEALLAARQGTVRPDGVHEWNLRTGDVETGPLLDGKRQVGTELRVPLAPRPDFIREVLAEAFTLAQEAGMRLFDPQLGRVLLPVDAEEVVGQYLRTEEYARTAKPMEVTEGLEEAMERASRVDKGMPPGGMSMPVKLLLFAGGGGLILYFVMKDLLSKLSGD